MTDKEIIRAIKCCTSGKDAPCMNCPKYKEHSTKCFDELMTEALDLINRQQEKLKIQANNIHALLKMDDIEVQRVKKEAIKEFAEKLEHKLADNGDMTMAMWLSVVTDMHDIVKEMGADNG